MSERSLGNPSGTAILRRANRLQRRVRRGVSSVLAMMLAVLLASLAAAMATVTQGNLQTASSHVHVMRSSSAAETGLAIAEYRLRHAAERFVVEQSDLNGGFGLRLWTGSTTASDGQIDVLPPPSGTVEPSIPSGISEALAYAHANDTTFELVEGQATVTIGPAPAWADTTVFAAAGWVTTPGVALLPVVGVEAIAPSAFQIVYGPYADGSRVRAWVTGFDIDPLRPDRPIRRTVSQDFRFTKQVKHAVVSNSRVLLGKNVSIEGDMGTAFIETGVPNGTPAVVRSDFDGVDPTLDARLAEFRSGLELFDIDGDNRIRTDHPVEGLALQDDDGEPLNNQDEDGDGEADNAFTDVTGDGYVDEFDLFITRFDLNGDQRVALGGWLNDGTPAEDVSPEYGHLESHDVDLVYLIDSSDADRNRNDISGWVEVTGDGVWNPGTEPALDYDDSSDTWADQVLGWRDGFIDHRDRYVKVDGSLVFRVSLEAWQSAQGSVYDSILGSIRPEQQATPVVFDAGDDILPDVNAESFTETNTALYLAADGAGFWDQVADNLSLSTDALVSYVENKPPSSELPRYERVDPDANGDGLPENYTTAYFEKMPFNTPAPADWYYRPVFQNMSFKDVVIPRGVNGLFIDCTFAGVTHIRSETDNTHPNWSLYGVKQLVSGYPEPVQQPLDKSDFLRFETGLVGDGPENYDDFPDPPFIDGATQTGASRNTKLYSNNIRFHDCLIVGSIVSDTPQLYTHLRNKAQFTGTTRFAAVHPESPNDSELNPEPEDLVQIAKSSLMMPNYSVDVGTFNSPAGQNVSLRGAVIAGVLDIRGNADIEGALVLTFAPLLGEAPLVDQFGNAIGNPADFNTSIGYFGPEDGDAESFDPASLPLVNGEPIVGWDLDGDGLADTDPKYSPTSNDLNVGAVSVPFNGYGRISIRFDPEMTLPDGIMLPVGVVPEPGTYAEGDPQ
ncbi:MAG: hypothetical protein AAF108_08140 [Planctomycetota bacterium]